jgi:hypothetical protein
VIAGGIALVGLLKLIVPSFPLEEEAGIVLIVLATLDIFLTVLYARIGTGFLSNGLARVTWVAFRAGSRPLGRYRATVLSFCGPVIILLLIGMWGAMLAAGAAMIIQPNLAPATDFVTVLAETGKPVGGANFGHTSPAFRLVFLANTMGGGVILTLILTYLMHVYPSLRYRSTVGMKVHLLAAETGDAAELIAGLGPEGRFEIGHATLAGLAADFTDIEETHHVYPVLFYFRFPEPFYSISRMSLVALDTVTLIKAALSDETYAWFKESASVTQLGRASTVLLKTLSDAFLPNRARDACDRAECSDAMNALWRRRYFAAVRRLRQAGIATVEDPQSGAELYVSLRAQWAPHIARLAPYMGYRDEEIDPIGTHPEDTDRRESFETRLHSPA